MSEMSPAQVSHSAVALWQWEKLQRILSHSQQIIQIDGNSVDIPTLVAAASHGSNFRLSEACLSAINDSTEFFKRCLAEGASIYGVNTGFGGSADTRTNKTEELQHNLIDFLNCGITCLGTTGLSDAAPSTTIPEAWVRASMLVRANSLARGHSGVRSAVIDGLVNLLNNDLVPLIPLRGSISASGDLIPLSYIAGALQGKRGINVWASRREAYARTISDNTKWMKGQITPPTPVSPDDRAGVELTPNAGLEDRSNAPKFAQSIPIIKESISNYKQHLRQIVSAHDALADYDLEPLKLAPKEGLALVNGTAISAATGALAIHDAQGIALLSQILTAMSVEALNGTTESFDPFISNVRQHPGQVEAARNINCFFRGSKLVRNKDDNRQIDQHSLRQDRYSLRTTPQWIGPQLENLILAQQQVETECNSTTDNPLLDAKHNRVLHGGNFQALCITSAMEKVRQSVQQIGRMLFAQCSELVNPVFSNGLPPNLEAGEPSQGFLTKGVDVSTAALCSELGYLANPITPHVQTAEMGNQSLNSMAFVSARYTHTALDVMSQLAAAHIFALCQALDLRCIELSFYQLLRPKLETSTSRLLGDSIDKADLLKLHQNLWSKFQIEFVRTTSLDSTERFPTILRSLLITMLSPSDIETPPISFDTFLAWNKALGSETTTLYKDCVEAYKLQPSAKGFLGPAAFRIWNFVRHELKVPFHAGKSGFWTPSNTYDDVSVGEMISKIYISIKEGGMMGVVMQCVREAHAAQEAEQNDKCER